MMESSSAPCGRHQIMRDALFWARMAYSACGWFQSSSEKALRRIWIDDFIPEDIRDTKMGVDVEGTAWVCDDREQYRYRFTASVPQKMLHRRREHFAIEQLVLDHEQHTVRVTIAYEKQSRR